MKEYKLKIDGKDYNVAINNVEDTNAEVVVNGKTYNVTLEQSVAKKSTKPATIKPVAAATPAPAAAAAPKAAPVAAPAGAHNVVSPLPGVVTNVCCNVGDTVSAGQKLITLEAMKMENIIEADQAGKVVAILVKKGDSVLEGAPLISLG